MLAELQWQIELGATEAIGDAPVDRYAPDEQVPTQVAAQNPALPPEMAPEPGVDAVAIAEASAAAAVSLEDLREAMAGYDHCNLKKGARNLVFSDGNPSARVMIVGEAPGRDEDMQGHPFVGRAGQLLDAMLAAIGLDRRDPDAEKSVYITNVLPWRPPQNRDPEPTEVAMMMPFLRRHIDLADPDILIAMGNHACHALIGKRGITRLRGNWTEAMGRPLLPMLHPAYLLRQSHAKRAAWEDLLSLKARLRDLS